MQALFSLGNENSASKVQRRTSLIDNEVINKSAPVLQKFKANSNYLIVRPTSL